MLRRVRLSLIKKGVAIDLKKQQKIDVDPTGIQQFNFTENLNRAEGAIMFSIIEEAKKKLF